MNIARTWLRAAALAAALATVAAPDSALAFWGDEGEDSPFIARGAADLSAIFLGNNWPRAVYPEPSEGVAGAGLRLIVNAGAGRAVRFDLNAYQDLTAKTADHSFLDSALPPPYRTTWLDHDWGSGKVKAPLAVDQVSVKVRLDRADVTVGRQPVGLGSNFLFSPNDFFHPFAVGAADKTFRPGVDAARVDVRVSSLAMVTAIGVAGYGWDDRPSWEESAALLKTGVNAAGFDWSVLGGKTAGRYLGGLAISGEILALGLRCEGNVSFPERKDQDPYIQFAAGADHKWASSLHLAAEYYYHGNGATDQAFYLATTNAKDLTTDPYLGRHYAAVLIMGQPMPLLTLQGVVLANVTDPSMDVIPAIIYNAADEIDLYVVGTIPVGRYPVMKRGMPELRSELGAYPYSLMVATRVFF